MDEGFVFNGMHLAIVFGTAIVAFACGAVYGWLRRGDDLLDEIEELERRRAELEELGTRDLVHEREVRIMIEEAT